MIILILSTKQEIITTNYGLFNIILGFTCRDFWNVCISKRRRSIVFKTKPKKFEGERQLQFIYSLTEPFKTASTLPFSRYCSIIAGNSFPIAAN